MWNSVYRDRGVDHDLVSDAKEGVIVPGDQKRMVLFDAVLDRIDKRLVRTSVVIDVFTRKDKSYKVVICFVIFMKVISAITELPQGVGYDLVVVEEIGHRR